MSTKNVRYAVVYGVEFSLDDPAVIQHVIMADGQTVLLDMLAPRARALGIRPGADAARIDTRKKRSHSFDPRCHELASAFLAAEFGGGVADDDPHVWNLAQDIQDAVDDYFARLDKGNDGLARWPRKDKSR